jgi:hypothetical protein
MHVKCHVVHLHWPMLYNIGIPMVHKWCPRLLAFSIPAVDFFHMIDFAVTTDSVSFSAFRRINNQMKIRWISTNLTKTLHF